MKDITSKNIWHGTGQYAYHTGVTKNENMYQQISDLFEFKSSRSLLPSKIGLAMQIESIIRVYFEKMIGSRP